jgi:hypothetical protein
MAEQCRRLAEVAELPNIVLQVMPVVADAVNNSGIMLADSAAWVEHAAAGYVFTDDQTVSSLGKVMVRDTTNRDDGALAFSPASWEQFLGTIRAHTLTTSNSRSTLDAPVRPGSADPVYRR